MGTDNRRVAAYLPPEIDDHFKAFKIKHGLATEDNPNTNDSKALIQILSEYFKVAYQQPTLVSYSFSGPTHEDLGNLKQELVAQISELSSELQSLRQQVEMNAAIQDTANSLTTGEMAKRLEIDSSTLSHWKNKKSPEQLMRDIQAKDPDNTAWIYIAETNRFKKQSDIPGVLQGSLLGS